jgi:hypothetical protein
MGWQRLDDTAVANVGCNRDMVCMLRVYGMNGQRWPRLVISFYYPDTFGDDGVKISINRKKGPTYWWETVSLPLQLGPELCAMLTEFVAQEQARVVPDGDRSTQGA